MEPVERCDCCDAFGAGSVRTEPRLNGARWMSVSREGETLFVESPLGVIANSLFGIEENLPWTVPFRSWDTHDCFKICRAFAFGPFKTPRLELPNHVIPALYTGNWPVKDAVQTWRCYLWFLDLRNAYVEFGSELANAWLRMAPNAGEPDPIYRFLRSPSEELFNEAALFLDRYELVRAPSGEQGEETGDDKERWLTVTEAATHSGISAGVISRAADLGELKSNGKKERERRIDAVDLARWGLKRAKKSKPTESYEQVKQLSKQHVRDYRD
jgi:hypothetical protein